MGQHWDLYRHYAEQAEEARMIADVARDDEVRRTWECIAEGYEHMADRHNKNPAREDSRKDKQ